jgi:hypothetical protein
MKNIFLLFLVGIMYIAISESSAKKKAETFCDSINIGDTTKDLHERAITAGARGSASTWQKTGIDSRQIFVTFTGYYPGSDFICLVSDRNGSVVKKKAHLFRSLLTP